MASVSNKVKLSMALGTLVLAGGIIACLVSGRDEEGARRGEDRLEGRMMEVLDKEDPDRARALREKVDRLRAILDNKKKEALTKIEQREKVEETDGLTPDEQGSLRQLVSRLYDPAAISRVLSSEDPQASGEYSREVNRNYQEMMKGDEFDVEGGRVLVSDAVKKALSRVSVLKSYTLSIMHAHMPGDPERQSMMVNRVNEQFGKRLETVSELYPFLDIPLVEAP